MENSEQKQEIEICHVCGKEKQPYIVFLDDSVFSYLHYEMAREDGPICERCDKYYAMTGIFKDATPEEFKLAMNASRFAHAMHAWWIKDKDFEPIPLNDYLPVNVEGDKREWEGLQEVAKWYREKYGKGN